jgi:hypothetical protein
MLDQTGEPALPRRQLPTQATMSVRQYKALSGYGEDVVRHEIATGNLPHQRVGKRGTIRILTRPALAALGLGE